MSLKSTIINAFGISFYKDFIGFFLLVLFFGGGMMRTHDHYLLSLAISSNLLLLGIFLIITTTYTAFQLYHFKRKVSHSNHSIFKQLTLLNRQRKYQIWLLTYFVTHLLPIVYFVLIGYNAFFTNDSYVLLTLLLVYVTLTAIGYPILLDYLIGQIFYESKSLSRSNLFNLPFGLWYINELIINKGLLLFGVKCVSIYALSLFLATYNPAIYDQRWIVLGIFIASLANYFIYQQKEAFESRKCIWYRSLPLKISFKSLNAFTFLLVVNILELLIIIFKTPDGINLPYTLFSYMVFNLGFYGWSHIALPQKSTAQIQFLIMFLIFFAIQIHTPLTVFAIFFVGFLSIKIFSRFSI